MFGVNNYGYNPYGTYVPQRPLQQSLQNTAEIQRPLFKMVDNLETAKITEYPLDGSISYFPLTSGEAIVTKQLQMDGTTKMTVYKPFIDETKELPAYLTSDDLDELKEEIASLKSEIKELKKKKKDE